MRSKLIIGAIVVASLCAGFIGMAAYRGYENIKANYLFLNSARIENEQRQLLRAQQQQAKPAERPQ